MFILSLSLTTNWVSCWYALSKLKEQIVVSSGVNSPTLLTRELWGDFLCDPQVLLDMFVSHWRDVWRPYRLTLARETPWAVAQFIWQFNPGLKWLLWSSIWCWSEAKYSSDVRGIWSAVKWPRRRFCLRIQLGVRWSFGWLSTSARPGSFQNFFKFNWSGRDSIRDKLSPEAVWLPSAISPVQL